MSSTVIVISLPSSSNCKLNGSTVTTFGATLSSTVTIVVAVLLLPFTSVTVNVTSFSPTLLQSNVSLSIAIEAMPQLSFEPLSMSTTVIEISLPNSSNCTVNGAAAMGIGTILSSTVTITVAELLLPFTSVTVRVTVLAPTSTHEKLEISKE